jgi:hypothetical protein
LKACKHYKKAFGDETDISMSDGHPWNAWVTVWEGDRVVYSYFQSGLMMEYLEHLLMNPQCAKEIGVSHDDVIYWTWRVNAEWNITTCSSDLGDDTE